MQLPRFGMGCAALRFDGTAEEYEAACGVIRHAAGHGVQWFDTSPFYTTGANEAAVGEALDGIPRDSYMLSTKAGHVMDDEAAAVSRHATTEGVNESPQDFSGDYIKWSIGRSLKRLRTDRLDLAMLHDPRSREQVQRVVTDSVPALCELRSEGVIGAVGLGTTALSDAIEIVERCEIDCLMIGCWYQLLDRSAAEHLLPACEQKGIPVIVAGPFAGGLLADPGAQGALYNYAPPSTEILARARAAASICERHGGSIKAAALQFPLRHAAVQAIMSGPRTVAELEENLAMLAAALPEALWRELDAV